MMLEKGKMVVQIRDSEAHTSNGMSGDSDVTISEDSFTDNNLERALEHRVYIEHDHDQGYDVTVHHARDDDDDWSGETQVGSVTLSSGQDSGVVTFSGPVGQLRFKTTAPGSAITSGSLTVERLSTA